MFQQTTQMIEKARGGQAISVSEGLKILKSQGSEYTQFMAGAHRLKEESLSNRMYLSSIINAKSGRCAGNCSFCAQSSHHQTETPVYPHKS
ncbi:MAG: biotin synthase BioB, partial [Geopsychrobacter sp.]|nr:biotin synthase BioB [Geopsychrobacter sp.]